MSLITNILLFTVSIVVLVFFGQWLIKSITKIANYLHISEFVVGFIILAIATSIPELFVGIGSALNKTSAIGLGNVIGANLLNLTVVLAIPILISKGIKIERKAAKTDTLYMFFLAALPILLMIVGGSLSRIDGVILVAAFIFYSWRLLKQRKAYHKQMDERMSHLEAVSYSIIFVISLIGLFYSAKYAVGFASGIAVDFGMPQILIGLIIIALGTTLPEIIAGSTAALSKHDDMMLGNVVGSVVTNSTLVLGVTAIIFPIQANFILFLTGAGFMLVAAFMFAAFTESGDRLYIREGIGMLMLYILFLIIEMNLQGVLA